MAENIYPSFAAGEDLEEMRLVKFSGGVLMYTDAGETPIGITRSIVESGQYVAISPLNGQMWDLTAAGAIADGAALYPAADGKVDDVAVGKQIGVNVKGGAVAAGEIFSAIVFPVNGANDAFSPIASTGRWIEDFFTGCTEDGAKFSSSADKGDWLVTTVDGDSDGAEVAKVADDAPGGILTVTTNDASGDSEELQLNGESFKAAIGKRLRMEMKVALADVDKTDFFIGMAITDTTVLTGATDRMGFQVDHDGNIDFLVEQNGTESKSDSGVDIADCSTVGDFADEAVVLAFEWDGVDTVRFFVNGVLVGSKVDDGATVLIPDDEAMTPTICVKSAAAQAVTTYVDYIDIAFDR